ncbi:hypothetical protein KIN20_016856 [Parelaphostrongylus tenuis]|uniref:Uncharacterized protein n=1 Tax=Parelaphostrongylus tenuis TaxID=148309 RepID=A0AAD5MZ76_PARTN|nr:hypothetical protein KIN20_016856 [Parelaphostrongylus tenuis]
MKVVLTVLLYSYSLTYANVNRRKHKVRESLSTESGKNPNFVDFASITKSRIRDNSEDESLTDGNGEDSYTYDDDGEGDPPMDEVGLPKNLHREDLRKEEMSTTLKSAVTDITAENRIDHAGYREFIKEAVQLENQNTVRNMDVNDVTIEQWTGNKDLFTTLKSAVADISAENPTRSNDEHIGNREFTNGAVPRENQNTGRNMDMDDATIEQRVGNKEISTTLKSAMADISAEDPTRSNDEHIGNRESINGAVPRENQNTGRNMDLVDATIEQRAGNKEISTTLKSAVADISAENPTKSSAGDASSHYFINQPFPLKNTNREGKTGIYDFTINQGERREEMPTTVAPAVTETSDSRPPKRGANYIDNRKFHHNLFVSVEFFSHQSFNEER